MGMSINNNIPSMIAQFNLQKTNNQLAKLSEQLVTGKKINRASDSPSGLAIAEKMRTQIKGLEVSKNNIADNMAALNIADGAYDTINKILTKQYELAAQGADSKTSAEDRAKIKQEFDELTSEIERIAKSSQYNGKNVLDKTATEKWGAGGNTTAQIGPNTVTGVDTLSISYAGITTTSIATDLSSGTGDEAAFRTAMDNIQKYQKQVATDRTQIGVLYNRLEFTQSNNNNMLVNQTAALSAIEDLDYEKASADALALQIRQSMAANVLSLVNQLPSSILSLF